MTKSVESIGTRLATALAEFTGRRIGGGQRFQLPRDKREWKDEALNVFPYAMAALLPFSEIPRDAIQGALKGLVERVQAESSAHPDSSDSGWIGGLIDEHLSPLLGEGGAKKGAKSHEVNGILATKALSNPARAVWTKFLADEFHSHTDRLDFLKRLDAVTLDPAKLEILILLDDRVTGWAMINQMIETAENAAKKADKPTGEIVGEHFKKMFDAIGIKPGTTPVIDPAKVREDENRRAVMNDLLNEPVDDQPGLVSRGIAWVKRKTSRKPTP